MQGINFRSITMAMTVAVLCLLLAQAGEKGNKAEADYRIEVPVDTFIDRLLLKPGAKEIKFISPDGKVIKTLPIDFKKDCSEGIIAPTFKYLIKATDIKAEWERDTLGQPIKVKEAKVKFSYINAKGQIKWHKEYGIIYTLNEKDEDDIMPYFFNISLNGDKILLVRSQGQEDKDVWSEIVVFDTTGQEVAVVSKAPFIDTPSIMRIAPDGKVIAAEGYLSEKGIKCGRRVKGTGVLFFLDVETGKTKLVERHGDINGREWSASAFPLSNRKIQLTLQEFPKSITLTFDEIPEDLSSLFNQGGEK